MGSMSVCVLSGMLSVSHEVLAALDSVLEIRMCEIDAAIQHTDLDSGAGAPQLPGLGRMDCRHPPWHLLGGVGRGHGRAGGSHCAIGLNVADRFLPFEMSRLVGRG